MRTTSALFLPFSVIAIIACGGSNPPPPPSAPVAAPSVALHDDRNVVRKEEVHACGASSPLACETRCNAGDGKACSTLADMYYDGKGVAKDLGRANVLYVAACDHEDLYGCAQGGRMVENGTGTDKPDPTRAVVMYKRACESGYAVSCNDMGYTAERGIGQPKDDALAYTMYARSCDLGGAYGCFNKAVFGETGRGGSALDLVASAKIYERVCAGGFAFGCGSLGRAYFRGRGVTEDKARGLQLLDDACAKGHEWSCKTVKGMRADSAAK